MPKANADSISFPAGDGGDPIVVPREEWDSELHAALGEPTVTDAPPVEEEPKEEKKSAGINSSASSESSKNTSGSSSRKTSSR
jgi:hypothetical protein